MKRPRHLKSILWGRECDRRGVKLPCWWCGRRMTYEQATADHEPSLALGGKPYQAVLACRKCNEERGKVTDKQVKAKRKRKP